MCKKDIAKKVASALREKGFLAYFAGGCVRDMIMGVPPADYDIATDAVPNTVAGIFPRTFLVGVQYGVVLVLMDGIGFEVTTFRKDGCYVDGRHPENVEFSSTPEQDAQRRDFTINGLLYDPFEDKVLDFVGGLADIKKGVIRGIGVPEERFREDKLRLMRAVRFAARCGFKIEENTFTAIKNLAAEIKQVSLERIRDELYKIISGKNAGIGLQTLEDTGILRNILPEVSLMSGVAQPEEFHPEGDVFTHTKMMLDLLESPGIALAFGTLLHDVGKPKTFKVAERIRFDGHVPLGAKMADKICKDLRFSNDDRKRVVRYVANHLKFMDVQNMREAKLKKFIRSDFFTEELELHRVDCLASHGKLDNWEFCKRKLTEYSKEELKPVPIITGNDLISLGYKPGPWFKEILSTVLDMQLENQLKNKDEALTWVQENYTIRRSG